MLHAWSGALEGQLPFALCVVIVGLRDKHGSSLNVVASDKGLVVGRLSFSEDGDPIDCRRMGKLKVATLRLWKAAFEVPLSVCRHWREGNPSIHRSNH